VVKNKKYLSRVGLFVTIAIAIFIAAIIIVGRDQNLFKSTLKISTTFKDVKGLKIGNNVRFTGIDVGTVVDMVIVSDTTVRVELSIEKDVAHFIRKNSLATIGNEGLMGNKIMILLPGSEGSPSIEEGDLLRSLEPIEIDDIMKEVQSSAEKINVVSNNLIGITEKINRGDGVFGKIFTDTSITSNLDRTAFNAVKISQNLNEISQKVNSGEGFLGKLFIDTVFSAQLDTAGATITAISNNIMEITNKINQGEGIFGRLFTDTSITNNLYLTSKNLESTTRNLYDLTEKMNTEGNAVNTLIADSTFSDSLQLFMDRLNKAVIEATEASEAIKNSGLIRLFSKDPDKKAKKENEAEEKELEREQKMP
jgi:phospholipid/cholesterol/gamma-HCH transport system substrate-binding protein